MKNNTKKIVVLDRLNSARIEQAIFILRDENGISESDAVSEAERIVSTYLESLSEPIACNKKKKFQAKHFLALLAYTLTTVMLTAYFISNFAH